MRFLFEPCNNTLSHLAKCLALREELEARGHETVIAVSPQRAAFLDRAGVDNYEVLPDLQEANYAPAPGFPWFRPARFAATVRAEQELLRRVRPDRVLGVFRFTGPISARLAGIPYDSLICGCMTPAFSGVLGFDEDEPGAEQQATTLTFFRQACVARLRPLLQDLGVNAVGDLWELLTGDRTFLWDFPEFQPLACPPGYEHVGPVRWSGWPSAADYAQAIERLRPPIAFLAFGTGTISPLHVQAVVDGVQRAGYSVALALGGQKRPEALHRYEPSTLAAFDFLPAEVILPRAALAVCHGGQGLLFEAMRHAVPVVVIPFQPEQAQNGLCVERMGCGRRALRGVVLGNNVAEKMRATPAPSAESLSTILQSLPSHQSLASAATTVASYDGVATLARRLEQNG